jgi:hypothetical protein
VPAGLVGCHWCQGRSTTGSEPRATTQPPHVYASPCYGAATHPSLDTKLVAVPCLRAPLWNRLTAIRRLAARPIALQWPAAEAPDAMACEWAGLERALAVPRVAHALPRCFLHGSPCPPLLASDRCPNARSRLKDSLVPGKGISGRPSRPHRRASCHPPYALLPALPPPKPQGLSTHG